jgi:hypothetical protein
VGCGAGTGAAAAATPTGGRTGLGSSGTGDVGSEKPLKFGRERERSG